MPHAFLHLHVPPDKSMLLHVGGNPPKRRKVEKKSRTEKGMEKEMEAFMEYQKEAEERFWRHEEEKWEKERELEYRKRQDDQQHELRMLQMISQMMQPQHYPVRYTGEYNYEQ